MIRHNGQEYKVVVVTPAGRQKYLEIFKTYIYAEMARGLVDGWQLWQNTVLQSDIDYLASMEAENPKVKRFYIDNIVPNAPEYSMADAGRSCEFFVNTHDDDTIYIRFDDDVVWYEPGTIEKIAIARIEHPDALVIYPNVINSTICTSWHQEKGVLGKQAGLVKQQKDGKGDPWYAYMDEFNFTDGRLIDLIHNTFRLNFEARSLSEYYLPSRYLTDYQRFSICSVAWWGKDKLDPTGYAEEPWISWEEPEKLGRPNYFLGDALVVHYSYHTQRHYLEGCVPEKLEFYKQIAKEYAASI